MQNSMRTRYGVSAWIDTFPRTRRRDHPRLRGEQRADVVIVGGGLTGCATAYACAVAGLKPVVLEAERLGQGGAGRGAGVLLPEPGPAFKGVVQAHGLRTARRIFEAWRRASLDAAALVRRLGIQCGLEASDSLTVSARGDGKQLRREFDLRADAGLDVRWMAPAMVRKAASLDADGGIRQDGSFTLDPYRVCLGLASAAVKRGGTVFEHSRVSRIRAGSKHVEISVDGGLVRAGTVIICTGTATAEFKPLRRHFKVRERYLVMTEQVPAPVRKQLPAPELVLSDTGSPRHHLRWTRDNRLLVSGADQAETPARTRDAVLIQRTGQLMYELLVRHPSISGLQPEYGWDSSYGETGDGIMYIGPHRNYPRHLFALGGDSVSGAFLAARVLVRAAAGHPDKADEVFGWTR
jgi:glycine/D-amino acid oxidase-like deaminating enzyme